VVINDPNNVPETPLSKASIVDVRCTDQHGHQYIIEMQVIAQKDFIVRAQYYAALALARELATGGDYKELVPVIFIGVLDFRVFDEEDFISHHYLLNTKTYSHMLKLLEFHFIELSKFNKMLDECDTILDRWTYFLKNGDRLEEIPPSLNDVTFREAFMVLAQSNWSRAELEAYDRYLDAMRSYASQLETAEEIGEARGEIKGEAKGRLAEKIALARELLDDFGIEKIAKKTGLTLEQVEALKKEQDK
jgi:predicted transposase/invertase (TIGR01784 family)